MELELEKKEFQEFLTNIDFYIDRLEKKLKNQFGIKKIDFSYECMMLEKNIF